jgi:hypothetical protein
MKKRIKKKKIKKSLIGMSEGKTDMLVLVSKKKKKPTK